MYSTLVHIISSQIKAKGRIVRTLLACAIVLAVLPQAEAQTGTITFVSDTSWAVSNAAGTLLGFAQNVCLNASAPTNCPAGATLYGSGGGWSANLSSIPGATWIWAPGITGATSPAFPAEFFFSKAVQTSARPPIAGTISVAVDDFAEVFVNGTSVGTTGSTTDVSLASQAQSSLKTFDITSFLVTGTNVITVRGRNGFFGCGTGPYSCNPAGVVYGGSVAKGPIELTGDLINLVQSFNLQHGIRNSLDAKLQNALEAMRAGDVITACNLVSAFMNEVQAQSGVMLTVDQANQLINLANQVKASLGCS